MGSRKEALKWWRQTPRAEQVAICNKYYPDWPAGAVSASSSKIETMWEKEQSDDG